MQTKITMKYHFNPTILAKLKRSMKCTTNEGRCGDIIMLVPV